MSDKLVICICVIIVGLISFIKVKKKKRLNILLVLITSLCAVYFLPNDLNGSLDSVINTKSNDENVEIKKNISKENIPEYSNNPYVVLNNNIPYFEEKDISNKSYEKYSNLDNLGRCGTAIASVGKDLMPTEKRGSISSVKPTGWHTVKYDGIDGKYLYNRCHLIGYQLTGENANKKNLVTCTRYLNVEGMLPFENMVSDYIKETNNHVLYRVTPIYKGDNLLISGVIMEAKSIEDNGEGILFNIYAYNVQPGIEIDYKTGDSRIKK